MSKAVKIEIHKTMMKPVVVHVSGTLVMVEMDGTRLGTWERKICIPVVQQGIWRKQLIRN